MKRLIALLLLLGGAVYVTGQEAGGVSHGLRTQLAEGILQSIDNAHVRVAGEETVLARIDPDVPMKIVFKNCQGLGVQREENQWWVLPTNVTDTPVSANSALWVLPLEPMTKDHSWHIDLHGGSAIASRTETGLAVVLNAASVTLSKAEARPHSDPFGHRFSFKIDGGNELEDALAAFYWGTMLPSVVEKTMAADYPYSSGYVLSTLNVQSYAGSYPAVDHEFQIKGRIAMGTEADLDVVKRMIELQFKLMNDDPEQLHRSPTSVQPNGAREYHIRRNSKDNRENAAMFPFTGNIEVIEEAWHYYEARKDIPWLRLNIANLEHAAGWTLQSIDPYGRLWSDVYYEDQVMKDGRETQAQAFAAHTFQLLADMEKVLGRQDKATFYAGVSKKMADVLIAPLPTGYWDNNGHRFIDWVDRNGQSHDHIHLVANTAPVTLGYATRAQADSVKKLIEQNEGQFERFPSFVAADIAGYNSSEQGTAGPYDLSAAGRYWYWDAAFRESQKQNAMLLHQLEVVAGEGKKNGYFMDERYDMDYVYYIDGKDAHGAEKYYEYPNVYAAVLIDKYLGLTIPADADVSVTPHLKGNGDVEFQTPGYALRYSVNANGFTLKNLSDRTRRFKVDLSAIGLATAHYQMKSESGSTLVNARSTITLAAKQEAHWTLRQ